MCIYNYLYVYSCVFTYVVYISFIYCVYISYRLLMCIYAYTKHDFILMSLTLITWIIVAFFPSLYVTFYSNNEKPDSHHLPSIDIQ